ERGAPEVGAAAVGAAGDRLGGLEGDREGAALTDEGTDAAGGLSRVVNVIRALSDQGHPGVCRWYPQYCVMASRFCSASTESPAFPGKFSRTFVRALTMEPAGPPD